MNQHTKEKKILKYLMPFFKKYRLYSILAPLFKMLEATFDLIVPLVVADIINVGIKNHDSRYIFSRFALMILLAVLGLLSSFTAQYFAAKTAIGTSTELRHDLISHIGRLDFAALDTLGASTLITRMTADVNQVQNGLNMFLRLFLRSPFIVFGAMIMAFTINKSVALVFAAVIPVLFIIVFGIMFLTNPLYKKQQSELDKVTASARENLTGVRVVRAFAREEAEKEAFYSVNGALYRIQNKVGKLSALMNPLTYLAVNFGIILILWYGSQKVNSGEILSGDVIALVNYLSQILVELVKLANLIVVLSKAVASMGRIGQVLDTEPGMAYGEIENAGEGDEAVRLENAALRYPTAGEDSLSGISLSVKKGETVGIIGSTGSGKSTLVSLIARFYDATEGRVYLNGTDIRLWSKKALSDKIAVVMQRTQLMSGTIRSNLLFGKPDATEEEMWEALKAAQAEEFVKSKEGGLDAVVEQGGRNLSGGQKQRLSIARAVIKKPEILILDDSSSALDFATDAKLRKALSALSGKMTIFIISQRATTLMHSDKIVVLDDGVCVGLGTHDELIKSSAVYKEIYESTERKAGE